MSLPSLRQTIFVENLHSLADPRWEGLLDHVPRAGHVICGGDYSVSRSYSPGIDLLYCREGRGTVRIAGQDTAVGPGMVVAIPGAGRHEHSADPEEPWTLLWLRITGERAGHCGLSILGNEGIPLQIGRGGVLLSWFDRLFSELRQRSPNLDFSLNLLVAELWTFLNAEKNALVQRALPPPIERLTAAMSARPADPWPSEDMARIARLSAAQTRRLFRQYLQMTPRDWLRRERIVMAQDLLLRPGARVSSVAESCGFSDIYHFSREFRRMVGQSPSAWRQADGAVAAG